MSELPSSETEIPAFVEAVYQQAFSLCQELGGSVPLVVFQELIENLIHASFSEVVITILDRGNTLRISDRGPGIADKDAALRPGFTSADNFARKYIRGVGSGLAVVSRTLATLDGGLTIEDNLDHGTVITARVRPPEETPLAQAATPSYNLSQRQLKALLLTVELAPVGPTRLAHELGVSTSTAYRDLLSLEEAGYISCLETGLRAATEAGMAYLNSLM